MFLTSGTGIISLGFRYIDANCDRSEVTSSSSSAEVLLTLFRPIKSSISGTALLCSSALHCSLVCERPGPCYGRAVFTSDDLAVQRSPRSPPPHRQSAVVALVQRRRQPHALGSINKHEHSGYACRSKHFLFRPCLSASWTTLGGRWALRLLDWVTQRLHV